MTDIVINRCSRGTLLSDAGRAEYLARKSLPVEFDWGTLDRTDPDLIAIMREDEGKRVWAGECSHVSIITVPDNLNWSVKNRGNFEWVAAGG